MLGNCEVMAFVGTTQPERAKAFYGEVLGLKLVEDAWWAVVYEVGGIHLHIEKAREKFTPVPKNSISATDVMVTASGLLRAADLAVFELGMWQSWTGR